MWGATKSSESNYSLERISIHAPRVGRDITPLVRNGGCRNFNPRAPCGARHGRRADHQLYRHFNPRAPCGARPRMHRQLSLPSIFQSTRPVWGATDRAQNPRSLAMTFQSTRPVWGATSANPSAENPSTDFNPRAPCGARLATYTSGAWGKVFQSTRPVWGATLLHLHLTAKPKRISIHAPRVGRDAH